jgi:hypothetical protein
VLAAWRERVRCKDYGVTQIMVGLHRVGIVGLHKAIQKIKDTDLSDREEIVDMLMATLAADNYIPRSQLEEMRIAVWREFLRSRGEDIEEFFSEVSVTVCGDAGEERDRFVELTREVLISFELRPSIEYGEALPDGPNPQLVIGEHAVVQGLKSREHFSSEVRKSLSHW